MLLSSTPIGLVGERKAVSLLVLAFYTVFFGLLGLLFANLPPDVPERVLWRMWTALSACYGVGFFALAAGWFWARWFAVGLGYSGLTLGTWGVLIAFVKGYAVDPTLIFFGATHGLVTLLLQGQLMAAEFEGKPAWRERFNLDENGVARVRNSVTRAATSLLTLILFLLGPQQDRESLWLLGTVTLGVLGLLRLRSAGLLLIGLSGVATLALSVLRAGHVSVASALGDPAVIFGLSAGTLLLWAVAPFAGPMARFLRDRPLPTL